MIDTPDRGYWRVGDHTEPAGFFPRELCTSNHRFCDVQRRVRSIYVAELAETALRAVLADVRPKAAATRIGRYPGGPIWSSPASVDTRWLGGLQFF